jgi:hypothetical protein
MKLFILFLVALWQFSSAFQMGTRIGMKPSHFLQMAKKSIADLSEADLKGKRYNLLQLLHSICRHH